MEQRDGVVTPVLDAVIIEELQQLPGRSGSSLLHDAVPGLVDSLDHEVEQITAALNRGDLAEAARCVHVLAGSLGAVGARRVAVALGALESSIRLDPARYDLPDRLRGLVPLLNETGEALTQAIAGDGRSQLATSVDDLRAGFTQP